jgi:peptide/nickel transport system substrate-binding protein
MNKQPILDDLSSKLTAGQVDRRTFMQGALATGMTAAAATALADKAQAATPKKGGSMVMGKGHGSTTDTLDPGLMENGFSLGLTFGLNGYLTEVGTDGTVQPSLAESWEASADASTWTFKLRKGLEYHNGKSVTAEDVITSINHHRGEDSTSAAKPLVTAITDMKADGDTVVISLEAGNADFPFVMTDYHIPVMPAKDGKMDWQSGVGCGPYRMTHYEPGVSAEFEKFANHWNDAVGHFDTVQMLTLTDPNARTSALVSGDCDAIDRVDLKTAGLLSRKPGVNLHATTGTKHYTFPMRVDQAPFDDVNVRRALKYAVNRQEMVEKILFGYGAVGNDVPISNTQRFYNSEMPQTEYDPDKAKFYLKEAGLSSLTVDLSSSDAAFPGAVDAAVLYKNSAAGAGIDINVVREPNDGYWADVWNKKAWCACYWGGRPVEDLMFSTAYATGVAWNDTAWSNARFDELLVMARAELDQERRREMYYEMQAILRDEGGACIPMFASYVFATSDSIGHPETFAANWDLDGERWMERWWKV